MGSGDKCCVGGCDNDRRYPEKWLVHSHVKTLQFHKPRQDSVEKWCVQVQKGRKDFKIGTSRESVIVCSNHFKEGKPTRDNPFPTVFLTPFEHSNCKSPKKKRRKLAMGQVITSSPHCDSQNVKESNNEHENASLEEACESSTSSGDIALCTASEHISREADVRLYTGFSNTDAFKALFDYLYPKAVNMIYWKGEKQTSVEQPKRYSGRDALVYSPFLSKPGPSRKLWLEQEFLIVMMRLRLALCVGDLAFRFATSESLISSIFTTWIKLLNKELSWLVAWPSREQTRKALPKCFQKFYSKVRCIIDCSEVFIETPSSLEVQAACWSDYKHHCTFKFLIGITPNGLISFVSDCYGGRASDKFIVVDSKFMNCLEPYDQVMADRGFKIRDELAMFQATLAIPPSTVGNFQMCSDDVSNTSKIANVRIYVEQAIGRLKNYHILSSVMPMNSVPLCDDIVKTCCALCNLLPPLCE